MAPLVGRGLNYRVVFSCEGHDRTFDCAEPISLGSSDASHRPLVRFYCILPLSPSWVGTEILSSIPRGLADCHLGLLSFFHCLRSVHSKMEWVRSKKSPIFNSLQSEWQHGNRGIGGRSLKRFADSYVGPSWRAHNGAGL
nr:hypothetical protein [uncultured bacterium]